MKQIQIFCMSLSLLLSLGNAATPRAQAQQHVQSQNTPVASLEGTTWAGSDSDGDLYEFTFLKGGQIRYTAQTPGEPAMTYEDAGDLWAQNGEIVMILVNEYSTYLGKINGNLMQGKSWNVTEKRWTWELKKK